MKNIISCLLILSCLAFTAKAPLSNIEKETVAIAPSLRMARTEVSNYSFRQFLNNLRKENLELYKKYYPDTTVWKRDFSYTMNDPMVQYYFSHSAYNHYPVVGVSYEAAVAYCKWATEAAKQTEADITIKKGLKEPKSNIIYRLPTKAEWELAARLNSPDAVYAGGWTKVKRNVPENKEPNGYYFNHRIAKDNYSEDGYSYAGPVGKGISPVTGKKYGSVLKADKNGIYHLAGNVAEMIAEKGVSVGASFADYENKARIGATDIYTRPNVRTGFRYIIEIKEKK